MVAVDNLYTACYQSRDGYFYVFLKGNLSSPDTRIGAWDELLKRCRESGQTKLLVVQDSPGNATPTDAFTSSTAIVSLGLDGLKIAFADLDPANLENNKFGELVASNRGAWARVFTTEQEAYDWLMNCPS